MFLSFLLQVVPSQLTARDPAAGPGGRMAVSIDGDLWLRRPSGSWSRLTSGSGWDRMPAWAPDGSAIVFVSDRDGSTRLWKLPLRADAARGAPERLTNDVLPDLEPAVAADGTILFVRGRGSVARLWSRKTDGTVARVTKTEGMERWPALSPDGKRVAYVQLQDGARRLRVRQVGETADTVVVADRAPEHPVWSPDGARIAFSSATPRPGVYVTGADGRYVNLVSTRRGDPAWSSDGKEIVIAERSADEPGYNGDPDRVGDRAVAEALAGAGALVSVAAPVAPDEGLRTLPTATLAERSARNGDVFDRYWARTNTVYYGAPDASPRREQWGRMKDAFRSRAVAARTDVELETVLHEMTLARPPLRQDATGRAAVSSAHPVATAAGVEILAKGGNVVDAAVAVSFALGVVEPDASGVGGYGEMLVQLKGMEKPALFEFMARVPEEAGLSNAALLQDGRYPSDGPVLAMVPGTVHGMHSAWKKFGSGKVPWADLLAPAIRAARNGYEVSDGLATTLSLERDRFLKYDGSKALFFRDGKPLAKDDTVRNTDLAWTLEQIAKGGADGFYKGEVARRLVTDLRGRGNAVRLTDLSRYFAAEREPVSTTYRGATVYSSAPPAGGGATLSAQLNLLEHHVTANAYTDDAATLHAMISAWQLIPSSRGRVADPSLWPVNVEPFTNKDTAVVRWRCFSPEKALTPAAFRGDTLSCAEPAKASGREGNAGGPRIDCEGQDHAEGAECRAQGTTAFVVADADGNAVAVTQTLGTWGGNFYVSPGLGFVYNDKLTSYGTDPNAYGARLPYARHGSTLAPTIVVRGSGADRRPVLAVGAAGNAWINAAVYETLVGVLDFGMSPQQALEQPRFLPSQRGGGGFGGGAPGGASGTREFVIDIEDGYAPGVLAKMKSMGYNFNVISLRGELRMGYGAAVVIGGGKVTAGADPRRSGTAGAVP